MGRICSIYLDMCTVQGHLDLHAKKNVQSAGTRPLPAAPWWSTATIVRFSSGLVSPGCGNPKRHFTRTICKPTVLGCDHRANGRSASTGSKRFAAQTIQTVKGCPSITKVVNAPVVTLRTSERRRPSASVQGPCLHRSISHQRSVCRNFRAEMPTRSPYITRKRFPLGC